MALVLDGNGTMTVGNGDITGITSGAIESTAIGSGAVLQVVNYYNTSSYSASRTVATQIYSGGSFTKLSSTSKLWIQNDLDGRGDYIFKWEHPTLAQPTKEQLDGISS